MCVLLISKLLSVVKLNWSLAFDRINHTSVMAVVTPTDRPKSARNRCVIEMFGGVFCVVTLLVGFLWSRFSSFFS